MDEYGKITRLTPIVLEANGFVGIMSNGYNRDWFKHKLKLDTHGGFGDDVFVYCKYGNEYLKQKSLHYLHELNGLDELVNGSNYKNLQNINTMSVDELIKLLIADGTYTYKVDKRKRYGKYTIGYSDGREQLLACNRKEEPEIKFLKGIVAKYILYKS